MIGYVFESMAFTGVQTFLQYILQICMCNVSLFCNGGHSQLGDYFCVFNGKMTFLDNFTCLVCLDLYCEA